MPTKLYKFKSYSEENNAYAYIVTNGIQSLDSTYASLSNYCFATDGSLQLIGGGSGSEGHIYNSTYDSLVEGVNSSSGGNNKAWGIRSHAEGNGTFAMADASHAEGVSTIARYHSHAEGDTTQAAFTAHAEGIDTFAFHNGHAEGVGTHSIGAGSHAEGSNTLAYGTASHAEGKSTEHNVFNDAIIQTKVDGVSIITYDKNTSTLILNYGLALPEDFPTTDINLFNSIAVNGTDVKLYKPSKSWTYVLPLDLYNSTRIQLTYDSTIGYTLTFYLNAHYIINESLLPELDYCVILKHYNMANGEASHVEGLDTLALNHVAHAEGHETIAGGYASHAEGHNTKAMGNCSHTEGQGTYTLAGNDNAHAEGWYTYAIGGNSHAEGGHTYAIGIESHAEGLYTIATKRCSHAEGEYTYTNGQGSHAEGYYTYANGDYSHAEGIYTYATLGGSHAEGVSWPYIAGHRMLISSGEGSHAEGYETYSFSQASHAEGYQTTAYGVGSHAEGMYTYTNSDASHAEGYGNIVKDDYNGTFCYGSHAEGFGAWAENTSHSEGLMTFAYNCSHAEGYGFTPIFVKQPYTAETTSLITSGTVEDLSFLKGITCFNVNVEHLSDKEHATIINVQQYGDASDELIELTLDKGFSQNLSVNDALLIPTQANNYSHVEGLFNYAIGGSSHAEGRGAIAYSEYQHVQGIFNVVDYNNAYAFIIGNGINVDSRSNAFYVDWNGYTYLNAVKTTDSAYNTDASYYFATDGSIQKIGASTMVSITWAELKTKRDSSQLIPGQQYRITDYQCTTTQADTQSAGHVFDIIVTADDINKLNENARAIQNASDTYFNNCKLESWELKYCLDNDATRFIWANSASGKGVIYYMKDEYNNECPYDFKNIQFKRSKVTMVKAYTKENGIWGWHELASHNLMGAYALSDSSIVVDTSDSKFFYTFAAYNNGTPVDVSVWEASDSGNLHCFNNVIKVTTGKSALNIGKQYLNNICIIDSNEPGGAMKENIFNCDCSGITAFGNCFSYNVFGEYNRGITFANNCYNNIFGYCCYSIAFGDSCNSNTFGNYCYRNTFENSCYHNTFGNSCSYNTFENSCYHNTFGNNCSYNTFGYSCSFNTFENYCRSNIFGDECNYNIFGTNCFSNTFGYDSSSNIFGTECSSNTFEYNCYSNIFGNKCTNNEFSNNCINNLFGNRCDSINFLNTNCRHNKFGNLCSHITMGYNCGCNTFGNYCRYITFGNANGVKQDYFYINIESGNQHIYLNATDTLSDSYLFENIHIGLGVNNTETYKQIDIAGTNQTYQTTVVPNNSKTIIA